MLWSRTHRRRDETQCACSAANSELAPRENVASIWFVCWIDKDELRIIVSFELIFLFTLLSSKKEVLVGRGTWLVRRAGGHNRYSQSVDSVNGDYVQRQRGSDGKKRWNEPIAFATRVN